MSDVSHVWTHCRFCDDGHERPGEHHSPGLAIVDNTMDYHGDDHERRWTITHLPSGKSVAAFCCDSHAWWHADDVSELTDWTRSEDELVADEEWLAKQLEALDIGPGMNRCEWCWEEELSP